MFKYLSYLIGNSLKIFPNKHLINRLEENFVCVKISLFYKSIHYYNCNKVGIINVDGL